MPGLPHRQGQAALDAELHRRGDQEGSQGGPKLKTARRILLPLAILAVLALAPPVAAADLPAEAEGTPILPVSEVHPGMNGVARTVLSGDRIVELPVEVIAVMENALGPGTDLILARLKGETAAFTGVAAGMSGSPVYVDGRLMGALSYRIGIFTREPIAGITPIESMLGLGRERAAGPAVASGAMGPGSRPESVRAGAFTMAPIETPLVISGVSPDLLREVAPGLEAVGGFVVSGSGGSGEGTLSRPLRPGDAVAAQLIRGDMSIAASGTVTHVEGDRVLAFGHPVLQSGFNEFPMARAEVYTTLASEAGSTKLVRVLEPIGAWEDIRLTGSAGVLSRVSETLPVKVKVRTPSGERSYAYEVARHRDWTSLLVAISVAGSLSNTPSFSNESTLSVKCRFEVEGHQDVVFENLYTGLGRGASVAQATALDTQSLFGAVYQNRFEEPLIKSVEVVAEGVDEGRVAFVEGVWPSRTEASPGDEIRYNVRLRSFRGEIETRTFTFQVPPQAPRGNLRVIVGGGNYVASSERNILARQIVGAESLDQIIRVVNDLRRGNALYAKALRRQPGAVVQSEVLPALPPSILTTLRTNRGSGEVATMTEATVWEDSQQLDSVVVGGAALTLKIR